MDITGIASEATLNEVLNRLERMQQQLNELAESVRGGQLPAGDALPRLMNKREAAKLLNMSCNTLARRLADGSLRETPDGKITRAAVEEYLGRRDPRIGTSTAWGVPPAFRALL